MVLSTSSQIPLYQQLKQHMVDEISRGTYKAGDQIPIEPELSEKYGVSRITVRKAISELTEEGLLIKIQGKGTFVCSPQKAEPLKETTSFSDLCAMQGLTASARVLRQEMTPATDEELAFFELHKGSYVVKLERLRYANDMPVIIETNCFHPAMSMLLSEDFTQSLYTILKKYDYSPNKGINAISIHYSSESESELLGIPPNTPLLQNLSKVFDAEGRPLHTCRQIVRTDSGIYQFYV